MTLVFFRAVGLEDLTYCQLYPEGDPKAVTVSERLRKLLIDNYNLTSTQDLDGLSGFSLIRPDLFTNFIARMVADLIVSGTYSPTSDQEMTVSLMALLTLAGLALTKNIRDRDGVYVAWKEV